MLLIWEPNFGEGGELSDNVIIILYCGDLGGSALLYLKIGDLFIDEHFSNNELKKTIVCFDMSENNSKIYIMFDRELTAREIAEELSLKFEYNIDRIHAAMAANTGSISAISNIELAFVPKSKRAV